MLVRVYGRNATIDLFEHHLVITHARSGMFSDPAAEERFIPLSSILAVQVSRPTFGSPGKFVLTLAGSIASKPGTAADPNTVFFDKTQTAQVQAIVDHVRQAIATPSLEQLAMAAQRQRQASAPPPERQIKPTQAVLERVAPPRQSYNPNTGADYRDTSSAGHFAYNNPGPPPSGGGSWWSDMPILGKVSVIGIPLLLLVMMCSGPGENAASPPAQQAAEATPETTAAVDPSYNNVDGLPAVGQLVTDGDSRACSHPDTFQTLRNIILPDELKPDALGITAADLRRVKRMARTVITQVTLDDIRTDIHQMSCSGTLDYGGQDTLRITYTLQPAADQSGEVMIALTDQGTIMQDVLQGPLTELRNRRQAAEAAAANLQQSQQQAAPNADDLYAPH